MYISTHTCTHTLMHNIWHLCFRINESLHGNGVDLGQHMLILVQNAQFLHKSGLHLSHQRTEVLGGSEEKRRYHTARAQAWEQHFATFTHRRKAGTGLGQLFERSHHPFISEIIGKCLCPFPACRGQEVGRREVRRWEGERAGGGKERSEEVGGREGRRWEGEK